MGDLRRALSERRPVGKKGNHAVIQLMRMGRNVLVTGEGDVGDWCMGLIKEERLLGGTRKFRLLRMTEVIASTQTPEELVTLMNRKIGLFENLGDLILFVSDLDLLAVLAEKPQLVYVNEEPSRVKPRIEETIQNFVGLISGRDVTCVAYNSIERLQYITEHETLSNSFQTFIPSE